MTTVLRTTFFDRQRRRALLAAVVVSRLLGVRRGLQVQAAPVAADSLQEVAHDDRPDEDRGKNTKRMNS